MIDLIRKLAKSNYVQSINSLGKEMNLRLFDNTIDFTDIQMTFLRYVNFYSSLFMDISLGDIDDTVLDNEVYEDSYMMYKNKERGKKFKNVNSGKDNQNVSERKKIGTSSWIFKNKPRVGK